MKLVQFHPEARLLPGQEVEGKDQAEGQSGGRSASPDRACSNKERNIALWKKSKRNSLYLCP